MAKAEGFKNKITKAQEDLFKAIDVEKGKKKVLSEKIVLELSKIEFMLVWRHLDSPKGESIKINYKDGEVL